MGGDAGVVSWYNNLVQFIEFTQTCTMLLVDIFQLGKLFNIFSYIKAVILLN